VRIVSDSGVSAGVRRIEALTGNAARAYLAEQDARVKELAGLFRTSADGVVERVKTLIDEKKALEKQLADAKRALALGGGAGATGNGAAAAGPAIKTIGSVKLLPRLVEGLNPKDLRTLVDEGKKQVVSGIVVIVGKTEDGKAGLAVGVTDDLVKTWSAVDLVKVGAEALGGKGGGGRPDMAQAGGPDGGKAADALAAIEARVKG
jgi:alanyl-tRNA synthetase